MGYPVDISQNTIYFLGMHEQQSYLGGSHELC